MDDARPGFPETESVTVGHAPQEIVHLAVRLGGRRHVGGRSAVGHDQMVAMDRSRHRRTVAPGVHELQQRHLRRGILHGHAVGAEVHVVFAPDERPGVRAVEQMGVKNLFGQRQGRALGLARPADPLGERSVHLADQFDVKHTVSLFTGFLFGDASFPDTAARNLPPSQNVRPRAHAPSASGRMRTSAKINILLKNIINRRIYRPHTAEFRPACGLWRRPLRR